MRLFNFRSVLKKSEADRIALDFHPRKFPQELPEQAKTFVAQSQGTSVHGSFRLNTLIAEKTGIAGFEKNMNLEAVERAALEKLKTLEEAAYKEAYALGLEEGKKEALRIHQEELSEQISHLDQIINSMQELKKDLVQFNEAHIIKLIYYMAERLAMKEIEQNTESILPVLKSIVENSQAEEQLTVKLSPEDFKFLNEAQDKIGKGFEFLTRAKLEATAEIKPGGCIVETNYGVVDATLEERLSKLWGAIEESIPKIKSRIA